MSIPRSILNWRLHNASVSSPYISEILLYSDVNFVADAKDVGPYSFLNALAFGGIRAESKLKPSIALRFQHCIPNSRPDMSSSSFNHYHGGTEFDEIAAVTSLELGCRIQAGPVTRRFEPDGDPLGQPWQIEFDQIPDLPSAEGRAQIVRLGGQRDLTLLQSLKRLRLMADDDAISFMKAARLYQQAVWIADSNPELCWILLVSAIEAAASKTGFQSDDVMDLEASYPKISAILLDDQKPTVAKELSGLFGATRKSVNFLTTFSPAPPTIRPEVGVFDFDGANIRPCARTIYGHRSKALHAGIPFPSPMCHAPSSVLPGKAPEEVPMGLAAYSKGATWMKEDFPCHLHTFEHLVRGALLNWIDHRLKSHSCA